VSGGGGGPIIIDSVIESPGVSESERSELRRIKLRLGRGECDFWDRRFVCKIVRRILKQ
jgi:hypothetical protein